MSYLKSAVTQSRDMLPDDTRGEWNPSSSYQVNENVRVLDDPTPPPPPPPSDNTDDTNSKLGYYVGIPIGSVAFILFVIALVKQIREDMANDDVVFAGHIAAAQAAAAAANAAAVAAAVAALPPPTQPPTPRAVWE